MFRSLLLFRLQDKPIHSQTYTRSVGSFVVYMLRGGKRQDERKMERQRERARASGALAATMKRQSPRINDPPQCIIKDVDPFNSVVVFAFSRSIDVSSIQRGFPLSVGSMNSPPNLPIAGPLTAKRTELQQCVCVFTSTRLCVYVRTRVSPRVC